MPKGWIYTCIAATMLSGQLTADNSLSPTETPWKVSVEYLHFKPYISDNYFAIDRSGIPGFGDVSGEYINNTFNYHGGVRAGLSYDYCDGLSQAGIRYTRLETQSCLRIEDNDPTFPRIAPTVGPAAWTSSEIRFVDAMESCQDLLYQRGDLMFVRKVYCSCDLDLSVGVGIEASEIRLNSDYNTEDPQEDGHLRLRSKTDGIGPQVMLGAKYNIFTQSCAFPGTLAVKLNVGGSLLVGTTRSSVYADFTDNLAVFIPTIIADTQDTRSWRMIPVLHTRLGLSWDTCLCNAPVSLEVGYELSNYFRAITEIIYPADFFEPTIAGTAMNLYKNLGLSELYLSASVNF